MPYAENRGFNIFAEANGLGFLSTPGDHLGTMVNEGPQTARKIAGIPAGATT